jgi:hypothetical protein
MAERQFTLIVNKTFTFTRCSIQIVEFQDVRATYSRLLLDFTFRIYYRILSIPAPPDRQRLDVVYNLPRDEARELR